MKTPIYLDYEVSYPQHLSSNNLNLYEEDPIDLYTDPLTLDPPDEVINTKSYVLAPRYYLEIERPRNQPGPSIKIDIHKSKNSLLKNKLRIALPPSKGFGINCSYKVRYFEWIPNINLSAIPSKKLIRTEYWYVPTLNKYSGEYQYPFDIRAHRYYATTFNDLYYPLRDLHYTSAKASVQVNVQRTIQDEQVIDLITDVNGMQAFVFAEGEVINFSDRVETEQFNFNTETQAWNFSKILTGSTLVRYKDKVDGALVDGPTITTVHYIKPLHPSQLVVSDTSYVLEESTEYGYYI